MVESTRMTVLPSVCVAPNACGAWTVSAWCRSAVVSTTVTCCAAAALGAARRSSAAATSSRRSHRGQLVCSAAVRSRRIGLICGALAALLLSACGGGQRQDATEPSWTFTVEVTTASFPSSQRLSEHAHLVLAVHNVSGKTLPDVAVTICNVTCRYPAPPGGGTSAAAFGENLQMAGLAHPSRPVWVVDNPPGGAVTAYSNTWALGALRPGQTA